MANERGWVLFSFEADKGVGSLSCMQPLQGFKWGNDWLRTAIQKDNMVLYIKDKFRREQS